MAGLSFSRTEVRVIEYRAEGLSGPQIADRLGVTHQRVTNVERTVYAKGIDLAVEHRVLTPEQAELVRYSSSALRRNPEYLAWLKEQTRDPLTEIKVQVATTQVDIDAFRDAVRSVEPKMSAKAKATIQAFFEEVLVPTPLAD